MPAIESGGDFWAITSYFNPAGYVSRRANYRHFRKHLGMPLITVELSFDGTFELADGDAEILIKLTGGDVMWQKERLLNLAVDALPPECTKVISIDCDVVFADGGWREKTVRLLDQVPLVHGFSELHHMPPGWTPDRHDMEPRHVRPSPVALVRKGRPLAEILRGIKIAYGFAWAAPRDLFRNRRFYDACIVGGGDFATVCAAYQDFEVALRYHHMNGAHRHDHFLQWAEPFGRAIGGSVGCVDGVLRHLWHGELSDRRYIERVDGLAPFDFDPYADVTIDPAGAWRWSSEKPAMHAYVRDYFLARREDG
jgi:hypothetical protein